jgi:hypothetical protein
MVVKRDHQQFLSAKTLATAQRLHMAPEIANSVPQNRSQQMRSIAMKALATPRAKEGWLLGGQTAANGQHVWGLGKTEYPKNHIAFYRTS